MVQPLLQVADLKTHFIAKEGVYRAVDGIDLEVYPGQILCVVGESGSGKSITSLSILRLLPKRASVTGEIRFEGQDLMKLTESQMTEIRGDKVSMIFQEPMTALNPVLTIGRQIGEVLMRHRRLSKQVSLRKALEMLQVVGVPRAKEVLSEYPHQLSGGLRQRVMIAMAMVCEPKLLIADEPTTALDVTIQAQVLDLMKHMRDDFQTAIILITHDLGVVAEMADDVVVMYAGQVVESVNADTLFDEPLHPYTKALLDSIPSLEKEAQVLSSIPGVVPNSSALPNGCRFASRCDLLQALCLDEMPNLREVRPGHRVRCHLS